jgi:hypothetical protein
MTLLNIFPLFGWFQNNLEKTKVPMARDLASLQLMVQIRNGGSHFREGGRKNYKYREPDTKFLTASIAHESESMQVLRHSLILRWGRASLQQSKAIYSKKGYLLRFCDPGEFSSLVLECIRNTYLNGTGVLSA